MNPEHECLASRRGLLKPWASYGLTGPLGICLHTTGVGVLARAEREHTTPMEAAIKVYTQIMTASPHFVIGHDGEIVQVCSTDLVAWHAGHTARERVLYHSPKAMAARPWWDRWHEVNLAPSPLRMADPAVDHSGNCSIGVELIPRHDKTFACAQYDALYEFIVAQKRRTYDTGCGLWQHSDFCPETRTNRAGVSWDLPADFDWDSLD